MLSIDNTDKGIMDSNDDALCIPNIAIRNENKDIPSMHVSCTPIKIDLLIELQNTLEVAYYEATNKLDMKASM